MRVFVHEHIAGGGCCGEDLPPSLLREGRAMLAAVAADLARLPGVSVAVTLDARVELPPLPPGIEVSRAASPLEALARFDGLARSCDGTLLIAPELDRVLPRLVRRVEEIGGAHLGSSPAAIDLASDKLLLPRALAEGGVSCVPAEPYEERGTPSHGFPTVVKPRRGAGSTGVCLARRPEELPQVSRESVATPFVPGLPASVLLVLGPAGAMALRAGEQVLSGDGRLAYLGGRMPLEPALEERARSLALRVAACVSGLLGFAGVDLLLGPSPAEDRVVEVNARLTTSYVGLRALCEGSLAAPWLEAVSGSAPSLPRWRPGAVRFHPDGTVEEAAP
ncbi:MAG: ATP-grasp domain-containing protein [Planctomycetes bacterium]|nr:ATP-grasp domain-containing protein [Planctomycetota bacterium]